MKTISYFVYLAFSLATAIIGNAIHGSVFWSVVNFFLAPLSWLKWIICHDVNVTIIKQSFQWFLQ